MVSALEFLLSEEESYQSAPLGHTDTPGQSRSNVAIITGMLVFNKEDILNRQQPKHDLRDPTTSDAIRQDQSDHEDEQIWQWVKKAFDPMSKYTRFKMPFHALFPNHRNRSQPSSSLFTSSAPNNTTQAGTKEDEIDWRYHISLTHLHTNSEFQKLLNTYQVSHLDLTKPAWRLHVIVGYKDAEKEDASSGRNKGIGTGNDNRAEQTKIGVYIRIHHSLCAGVSLLEFLLHELVDEKEVAFAGVPKLGQSMSTSMCMSKSENTSMNGNGNYGEEQVLRPKEGVKALIQSLTGLVKRVAWDIHCTLYAFVENFGLIWVPDAPSIFTSNHLSGRKKVLMGPTIQLEPIKQAAKWYKATFNEFLFAVIAGGIRKYMLDARIQSPKQLEENRKRCESILRSTTVFSLRPVQSSVSLDNDLALMFVPLPIHQSGLSSRLNHISTTFSRLKHGHAALFSLAAVKLLSLIPIHALRKLAWNRCSTYPSLLITSLPGPTHLVHINSVPLTNILFWSPQSGLTASSMSVMTYNGTFWMGYNCDDSVCPDAEGLLQCVYEEIEGAVRDAGVGIGVCEVQHT